MIEEYHLAGLSPINLAGLIELCQIGHTSAQIFFPTAMIPTYFYLLFC